MDENIEKTPKEIIRENYTFKNINLSKTKREYPSYKLYNNIKPFLLEDNKITEYKPLSKRNTLRIKFLHSKFNLKKINNSSSVKSLNLSYMNKFNKNNNKFSNLNKKLINKSIIFNLKSLIKNNKLNNSITNRNKDNSFNKYKLLRKSISYEELINKSIFKINSKENSSIKNKKKEWKRKLKKNIKDHFIIDKKTLENYNLLFKNGIGLKKKNYYIEEKENEDDDEAINNNNIYRKNYSYNNIKLFRRNNNYYNCFSVFRSTFRYEDYYCTPLEFLHKYYKKNEIDLMKAYPAFFGLNKSPFKEADLIFKPTLKQIFDYEDKINNKKLNKTFNIIKYTNKNKDDNSQNQLSKEKIKDKKTKKIKFIKINILNDKKRKKIKCIPFSINYEREIDPNEGTVEYFEQKYDKYMKNKNKKIIQRLENQNYKKSKFEFLKNDHIQKMKAELEVQRQSRAVLETIRKNYIASNYLINHPEFLYYNFISNDNRIKKNE